MIKNANKIDTYELPKDFPGIDETIEFKAKLSTIYNNTKDRRDKIISKLHHLEPLLVES